MAEKTRQQISRPIALSQFQVADDRIDREPLARRQFLPRHLQTHASLGGLCLDEKGSITARHPAENYSSFIDSSANEFLGQLAGP